MLKLFKWEIEALVERLTKVIPRRRWLGCPFRTKNPIGFNRSRHCVKICGAWFPKTGNEKRDIIRCPAQCDWGARYDGKHITRAVCSELRKRGIKVIPKH